MSVIVNNRTNIDRARAAWGHDLPRWVHLLASACDASNQRVVSEKLGKSQGYTSRLISKSYAGSYAEAERLVRAAYGDEEVFCPIWGPIPLANCMRNRRSNVPPRNSVQHQYRRACPTCPVNTDAAAPVADGADEEFA